MLRVWAQAGVWAAGALPGGGVGGGASVLSQSAFAATLVSLVPFTQLE